MTIRYEIDRDLRLVVARPILPLTVESLCEHFTAVAADPSIMRGTNEILDLSTAEDCPLSVPELYGIVECIQTHPNRLRRLAIVCGNRDVLPRVLLLQEFAKTTSMEVGVFQERNSAAAWLTLRADQIEHVSFASAD